MIIGVVDAHRECQATTSARKNRLAFAYGYQPVTLDLVAYGEDPASHHGERVVLRHQGFPAVSAPCSDDVRA